MKRLFPLLAVGTLLSTVALRGGELTPPVRTSIVSGGITIYYNQCDEAFARKFAGEIPGLVRENVEFLRKEYGAPADLTVKSLKARRDAYLSVIATYLGLKKPTTHMRRTFDAVLGTVEKLTAETRADCEQNGIIDSVQIWRRPALVAKLRANGTDEFFDLNSDGGITSKSGVIFRVNTDIPPPGRQRGRTKPTATADPIGFGSAKRRKAFLPVILEEEAVADVDKAVAASVAAARGHLRDCALSLVDVTQSMLLLTVLHEVVEVEIVEGMLASKDRRWFCEGMANFIAYRAILELDTPEAARRGYDLRAQLALWKKYEGQVNLPEWKVNEDLDDGEKAGEFNRARYAYATKAVWNIHEKHGREFFPRWCREIRRTSRAKTTMTTVQDAFERLTGEKLSDYYPRPLFN